MSWVGMTYIQQGRPRSVAPVAATTVFSTPDDGRRKRPKHVE